MELDQFIRPQAISAYTGGSVSGAYADVKAGVLPPPIKLGKRASGFIAREIAAVQRARMQGKSDDEIKRLVLELIAQRQEAVTQ